MPALAIAGDVHRPFNFGDLAPNPVPWDAWINQPTCVGHTQFPYCQTITQAAYRPGIVYPRQIWSMDPAWSNCGSEAFGIMDPPTALPLAQEEAVPTYPNLPTATVTSASPQVTPSQNLPNPTVEQPSQGTSREIVKTTTDTKPDHSTNAISISRPPETVASDPSVKFTFADQIFTAYSGGVIAAAQMTLVVPQNEVITLDGHTMSFASEGVLLDSQMFSFGTATPRSTTKVSPTTNTSGRLPGRKVEVVYAHGTSQTTLEGYLDANGHTIMPVASSSFTFKGQKIVENGVTFSAIQTSTIIGHSTTKNTPGTSENSIPATFLPSITSVRETSSTSSLPSSSSPSKIQSTSITRSGASLVVPRLSHTASLGIVLSLLVFAAT